MPGGTTRRKPKKAPTRGSNGKASSARANARRPAGRSRPARIAVAVALALAALFFVPVLVENADPWFSSAREAVSRSLGLAMYAAPILLLALAALLFLSLRRRGYRLHWASVVGWLASFVGLVGILHWSSVVRAGDPAVVGAGGSFGRASFETVGGLFGQAGAVLVFTALLVGGAAAGFGLPLRRVRSGMRAVGGIINYAVARARPPLRAVGRALAWWMEETGRITARWAGSAGRWLSVATRRALSAARRLASRPRPRVVLTRPLASGAPNVPGESRLAASAAPKPEPNGAAGRQTHNAAIAPAAEPSPEPQLTVGGWHLPPLSLLEEGAEPEVKPADEEERAKNIERIIEKTFLDFGVPVKVVERRPGPAVTQFGVEPLFHEKKARDGTVLRREKVKVREITARANDLALALAARSIRIEAPVPGRPMVGIEVPNQATTVVCLRSELESRAFQRARLKYALPLVLGRDVSGEVVTADLTRMPHLLIAGATGSGKSVCINSLIATLLMNHSPDELRFLMIDPKRVELTAFDAIPHLLRPVVVDVDKAVPALFQAVSEMDRRYKEFASLGVRNIEGFNRLAERDQTRPRMPYTVLVIDELADLMMLAADEVERTLCRLAQLARATGIHLVIATQRPSVDVVTGLIKANFPTRISFMVTSQVDSRTILDAAGAEKLLGRGDMLYLPSDAPKPLRLQGTYLSDGEIDSMTGFWRGQRPAQYAAEFVNLPEWSPGSGDGDVADELYDRAVQLAHQHSSLSISFLQRRLRIGWNRAARLMEMLEENGELGGDRSDAEGDSEERQEDLYR